MAKQLMLTERQVKLFNNGYYSLIKKPILMALICVPVFGVLLFLSNAEFGEGNQIFERIKMLLIISAGLLLLGFWIGNRQWIVLKWTVWRVITQHWEFDKTTKEDIIERFGIPENTTESKDKVSLSYNNILDSLYGVKIPKVKFTFRNNTLIQYTK